MGMFALRFLFTELSIGYFFFLFFRPFWGTFKLSSIYALLIYFGRELMSGIFQYLGTVRNVAHFAHVGGFLFGLAAAKIINLEDSGIYEYYLEEALKSEVAGNTYRALAYYQKAISSKGLTQEVILPMASFFALIGKRENAILYYRIALEEAL